MADSSGKKIDETYKQAIKEQYLAKCNKQFNKCSNSVGQRQENDELEESVDSECHNEVEAADGNVEKIQGIIQNATGLGQMLGQCEEAKATLAERQNQCHVNLCGNKPKLGQVESSAGQFPTDAITYKIANGKKKYQEAIKDAKELNDKLAEVKKKRDENKANLETAKKMRLEWQKRYDELEQELAEAKAKLEPKNESTMVIELDEQ